MEKFNGELWPSVKADIETRIVSGEYKVGERIPTIVEIMEMYDIGRNTAQRVIDALSNDGIIVKRVRAGSFVLPNAPQIISQKRRTVIEQKLRSLVELSSSWGIDKAELLELFSDF